MVAGKGDPRETQDAATWGTPGTEADSSSECTCPCAQLCAISAGAFPDVRTVPTIVAGEFTTPSLQYLNSLRTSDPPAPLVPPPNV